MLRGMACWCRPVPLPTSPLAVALPGVSAGSKLDGTPLVLSLSVLGTLLVAVRLPSMTMTTLSPASKHLLEVGHCRSSSHDEDSSDFLLRCGVHFLADFYVTSLLAPRALRLPLAMAMKQSTVNCKHAEVSWLRFNVRAATVFVPWPNCPDQV